MARRSEKPLFILYGMIYIWNDILDFMNLRVLIYMNPLVVDKISKKFLWEKDSGFLYTKQLIHDLPLDWRITVLVPKGFDGSFWGEQQYRVIENIEYDYSTSIHQNRYHFNRNILAKSFPYSTDIDIVINMQPETTANLKVFFQNQRRENPLIIDYFHWIDCKESAKFSKELSGFIWRQVEGYNVADLNLFHTKSSHKLFTQSALENRIPLGDPYVEYFKPQPTNFGIKPTPLPNKKIILFNHRLNNTTGWQEVVKLCNDIHEKRDDFVLWITDDQNLKEKKNLEKYPWIIVEKIPFESYGYLIKNSHFSICNTKGYATWNMAVLDSIYNGCVSIVPNDRMFAEMLGWSDPDMYYGLKKSITKFLDNTKEENDNKLSNYKITNDLTWWEWAENLIKAKSNKEIKKYDDVVKYIIDKKTCLKKDIINEFWSFHANSNFQLIRWKLLSNGFTDIISNKETKYMVK